MTTSTKQIEANRRNAAKSTGPRTDAGKQKSRLNSWKHGLAAHIAVGPDENGLQFDELRHQMRVELDPAGAHEEELVDRIIQCAWKRRRIEVIELQCVLSIDATAGTFNEKLFDLLFRYRTITDREFHRCHATLNRVQRARIKRDEFRADCEAMTSRGYKFTTENVAAMTLYTWMCSRRERLAGMRADSADTANANPDDLARLQEFFGTDHFDETGETGAADESGSHRTNPFGPAEPVESAFAADADAPVVGDASNPEAVA
ncbi:MAG: hypothetical protein AB7K09_23325, partial [Planctomycetota bacterium]